MKINWKLRLQNKATLTAIVLSVIALGYQVLGLVGIVPSISQDALITVFGMIINLAMLLGIVTDPTTEGIEDSTQAMYYREPKKGE